MTSASLIITPPSPLPGQWRASIIERHEIRGETLFAVTTRRGGGFETKQIWFPDRRLALAHALAVAYKHSLPVLDLAGEDSE